MSTVLYRNATFEDIPQFARLGELSYGKYAGQIGPEHWAQMQGRMLDENTWIGILKAAAGFVCTDGDNVVGMAFLMPSGNPWDVFLAEWSYIRMVGVDPAFEGRGIASTLTEMCIDHARATGETVIALHTSEMMDAARHIYERLGFTILKEIPMRLGKRYWLYTMDL